jgi:hypothetical protein
MAVSAMSGVRWSAADQAVDSQLGQLLEHVAEAGGVDLAVHHHPVDGQAMYSWQLRERAGRGDQLGGDGGAGEAAGPRLSQPPGGFRGS